MSTTAPPRPHASHRDGIRTTLVLGLAGGGPAYFVAFLFSYGFEDSIDLANHAAFLVLVAVFACAMGLFGGLVDRSGVPGRRLRDSLAVTVPTSLSLHALAIAVGSVVSALNKNRNSVSADFSTSTDVLVDGSLVVVAIVMARLAVRAARG